LIDRDPIERLVGTGFYDFRVLNLAGGGHIKVDGDPALRTLLRLCEAVWTDWLA
jgi:hypothetical protein